MWRDLGLTKRGWDRTPQAARTLWLALQQQVRLMGIRFAAYEKQPADLRDLRAQVADLKAEAAELRERLGQNSSNSSRPPSSDPPPYKPGPRREPKGRKRGGRPGHQGSARELLNAAERALRRAVLWRRKSFGTQSAAGGRSVGRVLTAVQSLRQQGRDVLEYPAGVCRAALSGEPPGRLMPKLLSTNP